MTSTPVMATPGILPDDRRPEDACRGAHVQAVEHPAGTPEGLARDAPLLAGPDPSEATPGRRRNAKWRQ